MTWMARTRHRRFEKTEAALRNTRAERRDPIRVARAGAQHDLAGTLTERRQYSVLDHLLDLIRTEHGQHDGVASTGDVGGGRGRLPTEHHQPISSCPIDVEADDVQPCANEPAPRPAGRYRQVLWGGGSTMAA